MLCNALLLNPDTRQVFVSLGFEGKACEKLKSDSPDDEFLVSRLLFLTTYGTDIDLAKLIDDHDLAKSVAEALGRHARRLSSKAPGKASPDPMADMALIETLKLQFNVTRFCDTHVDAFTPTIPHIVALLRTLDIQPTAPLSPPIGSLINALMNLNLTHPLAQSSLCPPESEGSDLLGPTNRLIHLLDLSLKTCPDSELEQTITPLVCVLSSIHELATKSTAGDDAAASATNPTLDKVRQLIRSSLLPTESDRSNVLGKGDTLASRLLRNSSNPVAPELRNAISHLLFDMSDRDASRFVKNVGYGYASGFLFQNNIPLMPENPAEAFTSGGGGGGDGVSGGKHGKPVNPITGQFLEAEKSPEMPEMTDEEKEREAEKLFVLFERSVFFALFFPPLTRSLHCPCTTFLKTSLYLLPRHCHIWMVLTGRDALCVG